MEFLPLIKLLMWLTQKQGCLIPKTITITFKLKDIDLEIYKDHFSNFSAKLVGVAHTPSQSALPPLALFASPFANPFMVRSLARS